MFLITIIFIVLLRISLSDSFHRLFVYIKPEGEFIQYSFGGSELMVSLTLLFLPVISLLCYFLKDIRTVRDALLATFLLFLFTAGDIGFIIGSSYPVDTNFILVASTFMLTYLFALELMVRRQNTRKTTKTSLRNILVMTSGIGLGILCYKWLYEPIGHLNLLSGAIEFGYVFLFGNAIILIFCIGWISNSFNKIAYKNYMKKISLDDYQIALFEHAKTKENCIGFILENNPFEGNPSYKITNNSVTFYDPNTEMTINDISVDVLENLVSKSRLYLLCTSTDELVDCKKT